MYCLSEKILSCMGILILSKNCAVVQVVILYVKVTSTVIDVFLKNCRIPYTRCAQEKAKLDNPIFPKYKSFG